MADVATTYLLDELVVDLDHLEVVEAMLVDLRVTSSELVTDDALGLGLLRGLADLDGDPVLVDDLLAFLRARAAAERDGWVPVMGKNRVSEGVIGVGHKPMSLAGFKPMGFKPMGFKPMTGALAGHKPMAQPDVVPAETAPVPAPNPEAQAGAGVTVGLVDTDPDPQGLASPAPFRAGHGRFVRDLVARQAPAATIVATPVLDLETGRAEDWDVARAMVELVRGGASILNLSLGEFTLAGGPPLVISRAVERVGPDVLVVAAAGNHGGLDHLAGDRTGRSACWPAAIAPCVAVGAVDAEGRRAPFSPDLPWVRCAARGVDVVGRYLDGEVLLPDGEKATFSGRARWSGTSFSTATVSGAVAARTRPGSVSPRQALAELLAESVLVTPFLSGS